MARPVIALLTDFGTRDHYAGTMKGVALGICPEAALVDITHDIEPQDVLGGALELAASYKYFPPGTVFLVVIDPGVGSSRRPVAAEAAGYLFVAPDNGVLTLVFREAPPERVVELTEPRYPGQTVSRTFEGRDRFAPAAAWLAKGIDLSELGRSLTTWQALNVPEPAIDENEIRGEVVRIDRFGNLVTNIDRQTFDRLATEGRVEIAAGSEVINAFVDTYAGAAPDTVCALFGSTGHLEIAINRGSAMDRLGLGRGARVAVSRV